MNPPGTAQVGTGAGAPPGERGRRRCSRRTRRSGGRGSRTERGLGGASPWNASTRTLPSGKAGAELPPKEAAVPAPGDRRDVPRANLSQLLGGGDTPNGEAAGRPGRPLHLHLRQSRKRHREQGLRDHLADAVQGHRCGHRPGRPPLHHPGVRRPQPPHRRCLAPGTGTGGGPAEPVGARPAEMPDAGHLLIAHLVVDAGRLTRTGAGRRGPWTGNGYGSAWWSERPAAGPSRRRPGCGTWIEAAAGGRELNYNQVVLPAPGTAPRGMPVSSVTSRASWATARASR